MTTISEVKAREILDSRGHPTVEADVCLSDGTLGRASSPSGASTGTNEAVELRDCNPSRFSGKGVLKAVENVDELIGPALIGHSPLDQSAIDRIMLDLDGTANKSRLGANAMVAVSIAVAKAAAINQGMQLYRYLGEATFTLPVPMFNILNGGKHAENSTDIQEFSVAMSGFDCFRRAVQAGAEVFHTLGRLLDSEGYSTTVGDEGGYAPHGVSNRKALEIVSQAIEDAGYRPGEHCWIAPDVAASELVKGADLYSLPKEGGTFTATELIDLYDTWSREFPIISIEDGISEDDWKAWSEMTSRLGAKMQLVGDDLYTTDPSLIRKGINDRSSNAVLIKLNQIGTVTETLEAIHVTKSAGWGTVVSHRSGETEDTTIADLAVATSAGQVKSGAPSRGERTAKYNRLLRIEEDLGDDATFAGPNVYSKFRGGQ